MKLNRMTRVNELLKREIGTLLFRIIHDATVDLSAITITHVIVSRDLREARVLVSIRDHQAERQHILKLLAGHRAEIQTHLNSVLKMKYTPRLNFELDTSLEDGDRVLQILENLETNET